jgi:hypothetical protein
MFIINDMELLERLSKHKILSYLEHKCNLAISAIQLNSYSLTIQQVIKKIETIKILHYEKEAFDAWKPGKGKHLSIGQLSTLYLALCNKGAILVLSPEDEFMTADVENSKVKFMQFDDFCIQMIKDERAMQLYHLIKVA